MRYSRGLVFVVSLAACRGDAVGSERGDAAEDVGGDVNDATTTTDATIADGGVTETGVTETGVTDASAGDTRPSADAAGLDVSSDAWPSGSTVSSAGCGTFPGPKMARIDVPRDGGAVSYCIDSTEVTYAQYAVFAKTPRAPGPSWCGSPDAGTDAGDGSHPVSLANHPVGFVDWCDASAYCKWAGKRLCGHIGGGRTNQFDYLLQGESQWSYVCGNGAADTSYPYGTTADVNKCITTASEPVAVASAPECHGTSAPFDQVFDMLGNAGEWEDACSGYEGTIPDTRTCKVRGGWTPNTGQTCDDPQESGADRRAADLTFRCCVDL